MKIYPGKQIGIVILIATFLLSGKSFAQRCYTYEHEQAKPGAEQRENIFEQWILSKKGDQLNRLNGRFEATEVTVPVVVHIIHNGEQVGEGTNLSDEQILSQIQVINEDFRRTNPDKDDTESEFQPVAADIEINFVLAKQDPEGLPTNGIVRVKGSQSEWSWSEQAAMKSQSYWPAEDYLNIWVSDLVGDGGVNLLGFAEFPVSNLQGLDMATDNRLLDGVAIDYFVFGSQIYYPDGNFHSKYNRGRTLTHEIGHFLGLRHIWGDTGGCSSTDYCDDTPTQMSSSSGCPIAQASCSSNDMFQNYMDFTNDACMNIFTMDQKFRMRTVIENSPRRASLLSSHALSDPVIFDNDAGILSVINPGEFTCPGNQQPGVLIKNYGNNTLTEVTVQLTKNGNVLQTESFNVNLGYLEYTPLIFNEVNINEGELNEFEFLITQTNNTADQRAFSNQKVVQSQATYQTLTPFSQDFEGNFGNWIIYNPDNDNTWQSIKVPNQVNNNTALFMEHYTYEVIGEPDWLLSPTFNLSGSSSPFLSFDVSYTKYPDSFGENLMVAAVKNCNAIVSNFDTLYYKKADELSTVDIQSTYYKPQSEFDWRREEFIDLSHLKDQGDIQLVFIATNGWGNNMFLDNIDVSIISDLDLEMVEVIQPGPVTCSTNVKPTVLIKNKGSQTITNFKVSVFIDDNQHSIGSFNINLLPGKSEIVELATLPDLSLGDYEVLFRVSEPNGLIDEFPTNNDLILPLKVSESNLLIPDREDFQNANEIMWSSISASPSMIGSIFTVIDSSFLSINSYNNFGKEPSWLVSPLIDLTQYPESSLFFDHAYAPGFTNSEQIAILISDNCGISFSDTLLLLNGNDLMTSAFKLDFTPGKPGDWKRNYISLSDYNYADEVRIALKMESNGGNNIHLDNLEFFWGSNPNPPKTLSEVTGPYPNPTHNGSFNITMNLDTKQKVQFRIINPVGGLIYEKTEPVVLNQTFEFDIPDLSDGIYLIQIKGETFSTVKRLMVSQ